MDAKFCKKIFVGTFFIFEFSNENSKFLNFQRILTEVRPEKFEWFNPSPIEPFKSALARWLDETHGRQSPSPGAEGSRSERKITSTKFHTSIQTVQYVTEPHFRRGPVGIGQLADTPFTYIFWLCMF